MAGATGLGEQILGPADRAVDELMGDPTAAMRASADLTKAADSRAAMAMSSAKPINNLSNLVLVSQIQSNRDLTGSNAAADARFASLPGVKVS